MSYLNPVSRLIRLKIWLRLHLASIMSLRTYVQQWARSITLVRAHCEHESMTQCGIDLHILCISCTAAPGYLSTSSLFKPSELPVMPACPNQPINFYFPQWHYISSIHVCYHPVWGCSWPGLCMLFIVTLPFVTLLVQSYRQRGGHAIFVYAYLGVHPGCTLLTKTAKVKNPLKFEYTCVYGCYELYRAIPANHIGFPGIIPGNCHYYRYTGNF